MKLKPKSILIAVIGILIITISMYFVIPQSTIVEDYRTYDTFSSDNVNQNIIQHEYRSCILTCDGGGEWCIEKETGIDCIVKDSASNYHCCGYNPDWTINNIKTSTDKWDFVSDTHLGKISNGKFVWEAERIVDTFTLTSKQDFRGMYVKTIVNGHKLVNCYGRNTCSYTGYVTVNFGGLEYTLTSKDNDVSNYGNTLIEIKPSIIKEGYFELWVNGFYKGSKTLSTNEKLDLEISGTGHVEIKEVKYKVPFGSCTFEGNRILGVQTFVGGQTITEDDLVFKPSQYCLNHPVIITTDKGSEPTSEPYTLLSKGQGFVLNNDQTALIFYTFYNDGSVTQICADGQSYDIDNKKCKDISGIAIICTEGTFDPIIGTCVVQPETRFVCSGEGQRYNTVLNICEEILPVRKVPAEECDGELIPTDAGFDCILESVEKCDTNDGIIETINDVDVCVIEIESKNVVVEDDCDGKLVKEGDIYICKITPVTQYSCITGELIDNKCIVMNGTTMVSKVAFALIGVLLLAIISLIIIIARKKK